VRQWFRFDAKADADVADVYIYDQIGKSYYNDEAVSASSFIAELKALPPTAKRIRVHVNSPGGSVFDGITIANALRAQATDHGRTVEMRIDGLAASAATIVTSAADTVRIAASGMVMIHEPSTIALGTSSDMRQMADTLDSIRDAIVAAYRRVTSKSAEQLVEMMQKTTWMTAAQAVEHGFATEVIDAAPVTACFDQGAITALGDIPEEHRAAVEAFIRRPEKPAQKPAPAAAADVLRVCREANCLEMAEALLADGAPLADVQSRVSAERTRRDQATARGNEITAACAIAKLPQLAAGYIAGGLAVADVQTHLTTIKALIDTAEIDSGINPDQGPADIDAGWKRAFGKR
jgi:ATP-dependent Clp protease protease subunit